MKWDGTAGYVTTPPSNEKGEVTDESWSHVLERYGLDPERYAVEGPVQHTAWDVPGHGTQYSYRAKIVERPERAFDTEELVGKIHEPIPLEYLGDTGNPGWRTIMLGDTHIGKSRVDGAGSDHLVEAWQRSVTNALDCGPREGIHLAILGDLIEGYVSQGGRGIAGCDLTLAEQNRVARHLVLWTIQQAAKVAPRVIVGTVPGNHGEVTRQQNRPPGDSHDIDIVSAVQLAVENSPLSDRVTFLYPAESEAHMTYRAGDTTFTLAHGHHFSGKMAGAEKWWSGMAVNDRAPAAAQVLLAGHFHSMQVSNFTKDRWIVFGAALENESAWFANKTGTTSRAGVVSFDTVDGTPTGIGIH